MNCRDFKTQHLAYTDGTLSQAEHAAAQAHVDACTACARFDVLVRRGLLIVRNLPPVPPRPGFDARLRARLAEERKHAPMAARVRRARTAVIAAAASVVLTVGALQLSAWRHATMDATPALPPVIATAGPPLRHPTMMRRDFMAAASAGIPLWPAAALLDEAPVRFVSAQAAPASFWRAH